MSGSIEMMWSRGFRPFVGFGLIGWLLVGPALADPVDLVRQDLTDSTCMDGTPAGFYYDRNATAADEWIVILQGSNICSNVAGDERVEAATVAECARWCFANEAMGPMPLDPTGRTDDGVIGECDLPQASSSNWIPTLTKGSLFDDSSSANPSFFDAQKIYVRSCSGDGWMGDADGVLVNGPVATTLSSFNFHGQRIINEVFEVIATTGLELQDPADPDNPKATVTVKLTDGDSVLFGGESRGAFGAWANLDRVCGNLTAVLPDLRCRGITASYFPGLYKPKWREDLQTFEPAPTINFEQWVEVRKRRHRYQGVSAPTNCAATFQGTASLNPVTPYHLDPDDPSAEMCLTDLGILLTLQTPTFVSFNRFDNVGDYDWQAGCDRTVSPPLRGGPDCFNNQLAREAGIRDIASRLPASFVSYFTASDRHLYLIDSDCQDPNGACWTDTNDLALSSSVAVDILSKADVLEQWLQGNHAGEVFWDIADKYPFP